MKKLQTSNNLFTYGYEGLEIDFFISGLLRAGVQFVVDVRELPLSRKRGFSKTAFARELNENGIGYVHIASLGCPKLIRNQYKQDGNWPAYVKSFKQYMKIQHEAILDLARFAQANTLCLVCFEADHNFCHRTLVADAAASMGAPKVIHLDAKKALTDARLRVAA